MPRFLIIATTTTTANNNLLFIHTLYNFKNSQSGLIMRPNRARMSDTLLESVVFLRCNKALHL